ncbi:MAG: hypothetical protein ACRDRL_21985, partial [Sciscionella sp.]
MRVSGEHPQVAHLPYGTGMPLRWLAALPLLLVSLGGPLVWYALVNQWVQPVLFGRLPLSSHQHITTGSVLTESQSYARVMSALIVLLLIFFVVYWRNAMMWSRILSWAGWLITFELAMQGLLGLMFLHVYNPYGGHPIATLLFLPAALVPAPLAILAARAAIWVLTRLHTRELVRSQSDIPLRSQDPTLAIWLQHNRLVTVLIHHKWYGSRYRVTVGLPWREFRDAQLGETHGGGNWWWPPATAAQLSGKILRIVGAQQQWLVPVADEHQANTYL